MNKTPDRIYIYMQATLFISQPNSLPTPKPALTSFRF